MLKFNLNQKVEIIVTGESGHIKGRADYTTCAPRYLVYYKAADGRASEQWFDECDLKAQQ